MRGKGVGGGVHNRFTATPAPAASEVCYSALFSLWSMELQGKPDRPSQADMYTYILVYIYRFGVGSPTQCAGALVQAVQTQALRYAGAIISNN